MGCYVVLGGRLAGAALFFVACLGLGVLGEERLALPVDRLFEEFPGRDAEVFGGAHQWVPVGEPAKLAVFGEVAPQSRRFLQAVGADASPA